MLALGDGKSWPRSVDVYFYFKSIGAPCTRICKERNSIISSFFIDMYRICNIACGTVAKMPWIGSACIVSCIKVYSKAARLFKIREMGAGIVINGDVLAECIMQDATVIVCGYQGNEVRLHGIIYMRWCFCIGESTVAKIPVVGVRGGACIIECNRWARAGKTPGCKLRLVYRDAQVNFK